MRERFQPLNISTMLAYLILPDGGKVKFTGHTTQLQRAVLLQIQSDGLIDPYGLETSFTYEVIGNGLRRLTKVTEPAGRSPILVCNALTGRGFPGPGIHRRHRKANVCSIITHTPCWITWSIMATPTGRPRYQYIGSKHRSGSAAAVVDL